MKTLLRTPVMNTCLKLLLLIVCLILLPSRGLAQPAATYYVATTGSDTNPGTYALPFATINKALSLCNGLTAGQSIAVASGTYTASSGTSVVADTNNTRTNMVTVFGYGATQPEISAGANQMAISLTDGTFLTFENFEMRSNTGVPLVKITSVNYPTYKYAHDIVLEDCDLSNPNTADNGVNEIATVYIGYGAYNVTVEDCYLHDSEAGIVGPGETGAANQCNNINILDNTIKNLNIDGMQFGAWSNVTIDGNIIENMLGPTSQHNDGIQISGGVQNLTITHNYIAHSAGQLILLQPNVGPVDTVLVENNLIYDTDHSNSGSSGGYPIQSTATHAAFINNTVAEGYYGGLLLRSGGTVTPTDTVIANNSLSGFSYYGGASSAYEDYNVMPSGGTGAHDHNGVNPDYVNTSAGNYHPASGSPLLGAGVASFSATVDGVLTNFTAPTNDLDFITRGNPPAIGAYDTTLGNDTLAYCGFNYTTTGNVATMTDGSADFGWNTTTWTYGTVVSPGLTFSNPDYVNLPVSGLALSYGSGINSDRPIAASAIPSGYSVVGSDGVTRLGAAGTTVWLSFLIEPTENNSGSLTTEINLQGQSTTGATKLEVGNINSANYWGLKNPQYGGGSVDATSAAQATTNVVAFLVVEITFTGTGHDVVNLWVDPPLGTTSPTTPDATLTNQSIQPFGTVEFKGNRTAIGDEVSVGTSWLSVVSGGSAGL